MNQHTRQRHHAAIALLLADIALPSPQEEAHDPEAADKLYESCIEHLRERTRDKEQFALVHEENANYGFRRNLYALKPVGVTFSLLGTAAAFARIGTQLHPGLDPSPLTFACAAGAAMLSIWWVAVVRPSFVRRAADVYAYRLLAACELLPNEVRAS